MKIGDTFRCAAAARDRCPGCTIFGIITEADPQGYFKAHYFGTHDSGLRQRWTSGAWTLEAMQPVEWSDEECASYTAAVLLDEIDAY
jgi:hypothetical protein